MEIQRNIGEIPSEELGLMLAQKVNEVNLIQSELQSRVNRREKVSKEADENKETT